jgi:DNA polymerase sigma
MFKLILAEYNVSFNVYGSFATDLAIESSDIDITVNYFCKNEENMNTYLNDNLSTEMIINKLVKTFNLNHKKMFDNVNPIYTASVPVVKLVYIQIITLIDN